MSTKTITLTESLHHYLLSVSLREPPILARLREETAQHPLANLQIAPEQGQFMALLVRLMEAKKCLELGVFTGYSALSVALALPPDGKLIACDVNEEWTSMARRYWQEAGVAHKIALRIAPALETLDKLLANGETGSFDFIFIDADKENCVNYYERSLELVRHGGLIVIDNVLWSGRVADPNEHDMDTVAIRRFNTKLHFDERIALSMLPLADGLTLAYKR
jgi:predicted O-methyltransferase YrrM